MSVASTSATLRFSPVTMENAAHSVWLKSSNLQGRLSMDSNGQPVSSTDDHPGTSDGFTGSDTFPVSREVQTYFQHLESRQCRTSSVGPVHTVREEQRLPILHPHNDGQDSGVEDLGMATPGSPAMPQTTLAQKDFMVYRRALLCAQFPVLSMPQPGSSSAPSTPSPYAYPLSPPVTAPPHFTYLTSRNPQARLTPDKVSLAGDYGAEGRSDEESEEEVLVQNEMLASLVRRAFHLNEERHRYYDEVIAEGMARKAPARILIEELVSRLSVVENNRHPFYNPHAFEPRAYDIWQQGERRHIGELIEMFWQFSLPSPVSTLVKPSYWQSVHQEYHDLMVRLIRLDRTQGVNSYSFSMLSSTSRRLLKEFGLRYGVGELYRRIVFLEYITDKCHFECEVWYMEIVLKELSRLANQLPPAPNQARFVMVRHEFDLLLDVLSKLHEHSKHGLQGLLQTHEDCSHKAVALVSLLSSVLMLKVQLTSRKGSSLEHYLEGYIKESAKQGYYRHKLRLETELNLNTYVSPVSAELVTKLIGCIQEDVKRCLDFYQSVFVRYKQNIVKLAATTFYTNLLTDVNLVCEMTDIDKELEHIDQDLVVLAQKLSQLDVIWKEYIPCHAQQWRQPMLSQAKSWLKTMSKQLAHLVISVVNTDEFHSEFGEDTSGSVELSSKPRPRQSSILKTSPFSAFKAVTSTVDGSPKRIATVHAGPTKTKTKSRKSKEISDQTTGIQDGTDAPASVLYLNGSGEMKRIHSMPDMAGRASPIPQPGLRRTATLSDLEQAHTSSGEVRIHSGGTSVGFSSGRREAQATGLDSSSAESSADIPDPLPLCSGHSEVEPDPSSPNTHSKTVDSTAVTHKDVDVDVTQSKVFQTKLDTLNNNTLDSLIDNSTEDEKGDSSRTPGPREMNRGISPGLTMGVNSHESASAKQVMTLALETGIKSGTTGSLENDVDESVQTVTKSERSVSSSVSPHSSRRSSSIASSSGSVAHDQPTSSAMDSKNPTASVSFRSEHIESAEPDGNRAQRFSSSLVDVMFMSQRIISFMQKLIGILCPSDVEIPVGPGGDFTGSLNIKTFWERVKMMKSELKQMTEEAIIKILCLYANNLLAMDLCATEKSQVNTLMDEKVLYGILLNRQESMLSNCRHERESGVPCHHYMNRDTALLCDKYEPITSQMCVRINNTWSVICLLPKLASMLQARVRGHPPSSSPSEDDQQQNRIYDEPMDQGVSDDSSLAYGDHSVHLQNVLQAQINLLAYKLNLVLREALHVLLSPEFGSLAIVDRLQPLTSCLHDHWAALGAWLTADCLALFMDRLWLCLVQDFEKEVEGLRLMNEHADNQAILLSQSISHLIEFLHAKGEGLGIDQLVKPAEPVLNMLQLHSLSSKHLIRLYQKHLDRELVAEPSTKPLPTEVIKHMYQALHSQRKCFTGHHMVTWLLVHYYKAQEKPASQRVKYKRKAQQVGQKLLDMSFIQPVTTSSHTISDLLHDELAGCSSDASLTDSSSPYPAVTIHSYPKTSIRRQSQVLGNDSSEDSVETSVMKYRRRRTKRRISDFYSEEVDSSDDSSTSKPEVAVREIVVLKAEVHVSATVDTDDAGGSKDDDASQKVQEELQGTEDDSSLNDEQQGCASSSESCPKSPVRIALPGPSYAGDAPSSSSTSSNRQTSSLPSKNIQPSGSRHVFFVDTQHFYCFCDVDDQLFYSTSGDFTRSLSHKDDQGESPTAKPSEVPHAHLQRPVINAEFVLGILLCRRKQSRLAKDFTHSVPSNFWKEETTSPCCSCFK